MDKRVRRLLLSIIITFILVFTSIPLWEYAGGKKGAILAQSNNELSITMEIGEFKELLIIEDNRAPQYIKPTDISLRNKNDSLKECELLMLVDKKSTINYKYIRISIDDVVYKLTDLTAIEDNENYYFILNKYSIRPYSNQTVEVKLWIGEEIGTVSQEATLITNFITR